MHNLATAPDRANIEIAFRETGYYVRAKDAVGNYESVDIIDLDRSSLETWLATLHKDGMIALICHLLGHNS